MEEEASSLLKKILSPAEAQSLVPGLVPPPPAHAPPSGPGESTPITGSLNQAPTQATPSRAAEDESAQQRRGLSAYFATTRGEQAPDRSSDAHYIKVCSNGQVGYLPRANLLLAKQIDSNLEVLSEG